MLIGAEMNGEGKEKERQPTVILCRSPEITEKREKEFFRPVVLLGCNRKQHDDGSVQGRRRNDGLRRRSAGGRRFLKRQLGFSRLELFAIRRKKSGTGVIF